MPKKERLPTQQDEETNKTINKHITCYFRVEDKDSAIALELPVPKVRMAHQCN